MSTSVTWRRSPSTAKTSNIQSTSTGGVAAAKNVIRACLRFLRDKPTPDFWMLKVAVVAARSSRAHNSLPLSIARWDNFPDPLAGEEP